jgi:mRNA-capping enzyme
VKVQCRGHGETPSKEQTKSFIEIVEEFTSNNPLEIIGVHCTHGFNRTGFLIVSYLVEKHDIAVSAAIQMFAHARPPGIYKQDYIVELYRRYDEEDDATSAPPLPEWCYEEEDAEDDCYASTSNASTYKRKHEVEEAEEAENEGDNANEGQGEAGEPKNKKRRSENIRLDATFMEGVGGVSLMTDKKKVNALQGIIQDMCEWKKGGFPGAQPVSMDRQNIKLLHTKPYKVSWKADGTRYMMLIHQNDEIYFFDRDNSCFKVDSLKFPQMKDLTKHIKNTLLDGEMVIDKVEGQRVARYLVYDIIRYENEDFSKKSFEDRLRAIKHYIIGPRHEAMRRGIINKNHESFSVRAKDFWDVTQAGALLGPKFAQQLSHEPDGLIFQPKLEPYVGGRCDDVLKWKPADQNSVDFQLKITEECGVG